MTLHVVLELMDLAEVLETDETPVAVDSPELVRLVLEEAVLLCDRV
jgi:hypothetical protein